MPSDRKRIPFFAGLLALTALLLFPIYFRDTGKVPAPEISLVEAILKSMPLEEKIGQMLVVGFFGRELSAETSRWMRDCAVGSVVLLGYNVGTRAQTLALTGQLRGVSSFASGLPVMIAADQEGGAASRFRFEGMDTVLPQRKIRDRNEAYRTAVRRGKELRKLGIDINFSPVLDLPVFAGDYIYLRAFRGNEKLAGELGAAMLRGYSQAGVVSVLKHFPGHGGTAQNSHAGLPVIHRGNNAWDKNVYPFKQAIRAGAEIILVGHLKIPERDARYPASLSTAIISGCLRGELGYGNLIMTDDLLMKGAHGAYKVTEAALLGVKAGADLLLVMSGPEDYRPIIKKIKAAVESGKIKEERIDESVRRILKLKEKLGLLKAGTAFPRLNQPAPERRAKL